MRIAKKLYFYRPFPTLRVSTLVVEINARKDYSKNMNPIYIKSTYNTPEVNFDAKKGLLEFTGRSIPEHAIFFYEQLVNWAKEYADSNPSETTVNIKLDYLNSSSHKFMLELLEKLEPLRTNGHKLTINWYYEFDDEEMLDMGKEFEMLLKIPFTMISVEEF